MNIDEKKAVENLGGQKEIYRELLLYCLELEEQRWNEIQDSFDKEDFKEYELRVHALKGAMLSLGIDEMARMSEAQERACKEGDWKKVRQQHAELHEMYHKAHRSIETFLKSYRI
ncbi:MAG: Hpt domain-containing protein [Clostridium sp.]|nr:Hpt domain-containing protein [Clostridium sp.]